MARSTTKGAPSLARVAPFGARPLLCQEKHGLTNGEPRQLNPVQTTRMVGLNQSGPRFLGEVARIPKEHAFGQQRQHDQMIVLGDPGCPTGPCVRIQGPKNGGGTTTYRATLPYGP